MPDCERRRGGDTPIPVTECDADAQTFITAAGITDDVQQGAICKLVSDLKTYPAVGTKYWNREILVYPFVGGNATAHAVNLKTPGTNNLTFVGAGLVHSALGVQGDGLASYANTGYLIVSQNLVRAMFYVDLDMTTAAGTEYFGCRNNPFTSGFEARLGVALFQYLCNDTIARNSSTPLILGCRLIERYIAANKQSTQGNQLWDVEAVASVANAHNNPIFLFARSGLVSVPATFSNARMSSFTYGDPLDTGGGNAEHLEYKGIWDAFNITLGRGHP